MLFEIAPGLNSLLEFSPFPSSDFKMKLVKIIMIDMAATVLVESVAHWGLYKVIIVLMPMGFLVFFCYITLEFQRACATKSDKL